MSILKKTTGLLKKMPVLPFKARLRQFYKKNIRERMYENRMTEAKIGGTKFILDLSTYQGMEAYFGNWEPIVSKIVKKYVKPGATVIDIGDSLGLHAFNMKKAVGKEGEVFVIDAKKSVIENLKRTAELNNISARDNFYLDNAMLSDETVGQEMKLDDFVKLKNISRLDFILMDLDGGEYRVIKGGMDVLKNFKPMLAIETHSTHLGKEGVEKLVDLLGSCSYSFFEAENFKKYPSRQELVESILSKTTLYVFCK